MRKCQKCGVEKDEAEFAWDRYRCKDCMRAKARAYNAAHKAEKAEYLRRWYAEHPTYNRDYHREWRSKNSERSREIGRASTNRLRQTAEGRKHFAAGQIVRLAVWAGIIEKPDACQGCGEIVGKRRLQGHHRDYDQPLDVSWLCRLCHGAEHRRLSG